MLLLFLLLLPFGCASTQKSCDLSKVEKSLNHIKVMVDATAVMIYEATQPRQKIPDRKVLLLKRNAAFALKHGVSANDIPKLDSRLLQILAFVAKWSEDRGITLKVTSLHRPYPDGISKTKTHSTYRAADFSAHPYTRQQLNLLKKVVDREFSSFGAISHKTGKPTPIVIHDVGCGLHIHVQVKGT